jgi:hypothetical protein
MHDVMLARGVNGANFSAHSQGNILIQSGLMNLSLDGIDMRHTEIVNGIRVNKNNFSVSSYGSPVNNKNMQDALNEKEILYSTSIANDGDFVAKFIGGNKGKYVNNEGDNPIIKYNTMSIFSSERWTDGGNPFLLIIGNKYNFSDDGKKNIVSPHSSYSCVGMCGNSAPWSDEK